MARPKPTYLERGQLATHASLTAPSVVHQAGDDELPACLCERVPVWRALYLQVKAPARQDLVATLKRLSVAGHDELRTAARVLDLWTQAELATAALRVDGAEGDLDPAGWSPERLRPMAREALANPSLRRFAKTKTVHKDARILGTLRELWRRAGRPARPGARARAMIDAQYDELRRWLEAERFPSFTAFARDIFARLGRPMSESSIRALEAWHPDKKG